MRLTTSIAARVGTPICSVQEQAVVRFASLQLFVLIYFQKFSLTGSSLPLSVPMMIMLAGIAGMVMSQNLSFVAPRLVSYMIFVSLCLWSQSLVGGSILSLSQLILLYSAMTVCVTVSEVSFRRILDRFITFMFLPACIIIVQYSYQRITGLGDPISMDRLVPKSLLMPGYFYEAHYPWNSPFMRPNGFFFVEPATASSYTASAAIMEIAYFRRPYRVILMIIATAL